MCFARPFVVSALVLCFSTSLVVSHSSAQASRRRDLARGLDRADAVGSCIGSSDALEAELESYVWALDRSADYGRRYIAVHRPPEPPRCVTTLLRQAPDPWDDVADEMERYSSARDALLRAMVGFREAIMPVHADAAATEAAHGRLASADAGIVEARERLIDVLHVRMRGVSRLFERTLASDRTRVDDLAVFRAYQAAQELRYAWHHVSEGEASVAALRAAIAQFRGVAADLPGEAGTTGFRDAVRALDEELAVLPTGAEMPTVEPERANALRLAVTHAYDECAPTVRLPSTRH